MTEQTPDPTDPTPVVDVTSLDDDALQALREQAAAEQVKRDKIASLADQWDALLEQLEVLGLDPEEKFKEARTKRAAKLKEQQERAASVAPVETSDTTDVPDADAADDDDETDSATDLGKALGI